MVALALIGAPMAPAAAPQQHDETRDAWQEHALLRARIALPNALEEDLETFAARCIELAGVPVPPRGDDARSPNGSRDADALLGEATAAARRIGNHETRGLLAIQIAHVELRRGRLSEASAVLETALAELERCHIYRPMILRTAAEIARKVGDWEQALARLDAAENGLLDRTAVPADVMAFHRLLRSTIYGSRAQVWTELGVWEEAVRWLEREQLQCAATDETSDDVGALLHRIDFMVAVGQAEAAATQLAEFRAGSAAGALVDSQHALLRGYEGFVAAELERHDAARAGRAEPLLIEALAHPDVTGSLRVTLLLLLGDIRLREQRADAARESLEAVDAIFERSTGSVPERATLEAHRARLLELEGAERAVRVQQRAALLRAYETLLEQWAATPLREGAIGFLHLGSRRLILGELVRLTLALDDSALARAAAFDLLLRAQAMGSAMRVRGETAFTTDDVQRHLTGNRAGVFAILTSMYHSYVFLVDARGVFACMVPSGRALLDLCGPLNEELSRRRSLVGTAELVAHRARLAQLSRELAQQLLPAPAEARLRSWHEVIIVGDDLLLNAPLECLPLADGRMLGRALAVSHAPSLPFLLARGERVESPGAALALLLVAAPRPRYQPAAPAPRLAPFPFESATAAQLARFYGDGRHAALIGDEATRSALAGAAPRAAVLHFFAHGVYDHARERGAGLVLHGDGSEADVLYCADVERALRLDGLVVLSVCGTALGPSRMGDDRLTHLGGAFLNAGARAVVLTRAEIDFAGTVELMQEFHRHLAAGRSPAEALRAARARRSDAHAFDDAQIQVIGHGHERLFAPAPLAAHARRWARWIAPTLGALALLGLCVLGLRARTRAAKT